jgi:ribosomal protein L4
MTLRATPQNIPVLDMSGKQIGEEILNFRTLSKETANYVVHHALTVWMYQQKKWTFYAPRRSDVKKGKKPWGQKGSGKARHGSRYSPLFGRSATNKAPHGLDNKRKKKLSRHQHIMSISTVLQSKWRGMKIIDGLEDWESNKQTELEGCLKGWTGMNPGNFRWKNTLLLVRRGFGTINKRTTLPTVASYDAPLFMSGRLIPKLAIRKPRHIDPLGDGLYQCLKGRNLLISREAFFDLHAKYNVDDGWAFKGERSILVEQLQKLAKEFPLERAEEIEAARELPRSRDARERWATKERKMLEASAAA